MRLLRPDPGECADRQTILQLKCKYGTMKHINVKPYTDEINEIQDYLQKNWFFKINEKQGDEYNGLMMELLNVNGDLWKIEDEVRLRIRNSEVNGNSERLIEIAKLIPELNDKRMSTVQKINAIFGVAGQEKVYIAS